MSKIALFHTNSATLNLFKDLCQKIIPNTEVMHIVEDSMIKDVIKNKKVTAKTNARIAHYIEAAEDGGCSIFMTACSSIGKSVEEYQPYTSMHLMRIDEAMAENAITYGRHITVLATVETTLTPTLELINRKAKDVNKKIDLHSQLMANAFEALLSGDSIMHDKIIEEGIKKALKEAEIIVLAQASMARILQKIPESDIPVLTSPETGLLKLKKKLEKNL